MILASGLCLLNRTSRAWFQLWPATLVSALLAVSSYLSASLFDAVETSRHLVLFQGATDLTVISVALSALLLLERRCTRRSSVKFKTTSPRLSQTSSKLPEHTAF
jgi:hypothetical protein